MPLFGPNVRKMKAKGDVGGLIALLADQRLRLEAILALEDVGAAAVEPLIHALADENVHVREAVANVLGEIGDERAIEPLIGALLDKQQEVREAAVRALGRIGGQRTLDPLIDALRDESPRVREIAVRVLGEIGGPRVVEALVGTLQDEHPGVRELAIHMLASIGGERAVEPLLTLLQNRHDPDMRLDAAYALGGIGDGRAVEPLIGTLKRRQALQSHAATSAGRPMSPAEFEALGGSLPEGEDPLVTQAVAEALGMIGDQRALLPLITALGDPDPGVCEAAARGLIVLALESQIDMPMLLAALRGSEDPLLREAASEVIKMLGEWGRLGGQIVRTVGVDKLPRVESVRKALSGAGEEGRRCLRRLQWMAAAAYAIMRKKGYEPSQPAGR